jgi:hypothetical protein
MWMIYYHHFYFFSIKISLLKYSLVKCFIKLIFWCSSSKANNKKIQIIKLNDFFEFFNTRINHLANLFLST